MSCKEASCGDCATYKTKIGLNEQIIRDISMRKKEPEWMLEYRLKSLHMFTSKPLQQWGPDLKKLEFQDIYYYVKPKTNNDALEAKDLGVKEHEKDLFGGLGAQHESEVVFHSLQEEWSKQGVIFMDTEGGFSTERFKQVHGGTKEEIEASLQNVLLLKPEPDYHGPQLHFYLIPTSPSPPAFQTTLNTESNAAFLPLPLVPLSPQESAPQKPHPHLDSLFLRGLDKDLPAVLFANATRHPQPLPLQQRPAIASAKAEA